MKKILLIGDSIRLSYMESVKKQIGRHSRGVGA